MRLTLAFTLAFVAAVAAFDAIQYARGGWEFTISYLILSRSRRYPIIALMVGVLIGHLFWPQPEPDDDASR